MNEERRVNVHYTHRCRRTKSVVETTDVIGCDSQRQTFVGQHIELSCPRDLLEELELVPTTPYDWT